MTHAPTAAPATRGGLPRPDGARGRGSRLRVWARGLLVAASGAVAANSIAQESHFVGLFPAHGGARQGFVRLINHGDANGVVSIEGVDDAGQRAGPVTLRLDAGRTAHFNSRDFEQGNAGKGLSVGVGPPSSGDWRLTLTSTLDIEALPYLRTPEDGFLTSMRDLAPEAEGNHRIVVFNPAKNENQVSQLRLINPGADAADVVIRGVDDHGQAGAAEVRLSLPGHAARTYTAQELERGQEDLQGALGAGAGKWRLTVSSAASIHVMSLLLSETAGRLANLSSVPGAADVSGETKTHHVPLFPAKDDPSGRQGFLRVVNRAEHEVEVTITAFDDAGAARPPVMLQVDRGRTVHFNSIHLEDGKPDRGLSAGVGAGDGDWRLQLATRHDIAVYAYIRTSDGFLTSMHDVVPATGQRQRVAFFNPGKNENQESRLRVVNTGAVDEAVVVRATDDAGAAGGEVSFTVPAHGARAFSVKELEQGHRGELGALADFTGALGTGTGKWQLEVEANPAIRTMSLLASPTGHLTNLSTAAPFAAPVPVETAADVFATSVSAPIVQGQCVNCHVAGGRSGHTRLVFVPASEVDDHLARNLAAFRSLLGRTASGKALVLDKVRGRRGHGGGIRLEERSEDYANLERFLTLLEAEVNAAGPGEQRPLAHGGVGHPMLSSPHANPIALGAPYVYVANTPADTVDVIDTRTRTVVRRIDVGVDPVSVAVRPDGREVWVANHVSDTVSVIDADPASRTFHHVIATVQDVHPQTLATRFDEPVGIAFASDRKAYVALSTTNRVAIVDVAERAVTGHLAIRAQDPRALVVRNERLYVVAFESNNQSQLSGCRAESIDGDTCTFDAVQHVFTTNNVLSLGYDADIVKNPLIPDRDLFVFDTRTDEEVAVVDAVGTLLYGLAVDGNGRVFVAQTDARNIENGRAGTRQHGLAEMENRAFLNQITRVDCADGCREPVYFDLEPLPPEHPAPGMALATPFAVAVSDDDATLVATAAGSDKVFTVDANAGTVLGRVSVGPTPRGLALVSDADGAPEAAWVLSAVENSVSLVDLASRANPAVVDTIALVDPTDPVVKRGRIAFNDADASSTGTFSCDSCHPDGHTDQLIWVLDTPACASGGGEGAQAEQLAAGCTQVPPRLTMPVRGLRDTQPYHWDGIPGDPYGGNNTASVLASVEPNCDVRRPETCTRQLVDGSLATTMCDVTRCPTNDEGKGGLVDGATRDALAAFILDIPYPPAQTRPFDNVLTPAARDGFFEFSYINDSGRDTGAQTCGACHRPPFLVSTNTPGTGMDAPTWRGANDRFIITPQARTNVIDLMRIVNIDDTFPERDIWILGGASPDIWEMVLQGSTGFAGAFGRQVTLNAASAPRAQTRRLLDALETAAAEGAIVLQAEGVRLEDGDATPLALHFADGRYAERDGDATFTRADLRDAAERGALVLTLTGRSGPNVAPHFPQPGLWPIGEIQTQTRNLDMPMLGDDATLRLHGRHIHPGASVFVNGRRVEGAVRCESGALPRCDGETVIVEFWAPPESGGLHFLQVQNQGGLFSNDLMFFDETAPLPPRPGNLVYSGGSFEWHHWDNHLGPLWRGEPRSHWNTVQHEGNTVDVPDRGTQVRVNVRTVNTGQPWRAQMSHAVLVTRGQEYTLCYDARAAGERFITAYMDTNLDAWRNISGGQFRANLTTAWQRFQHTFTVHETDLTARVAFDFAQSAHAVDIDNVGLYEGGECGVP